MYTYWYIGSAILCIKVRDVSRATEILWSICTFNMIFPAGFVGHPQLLHRKVEMPLPGYINVQLDTNSWEYTGLYRLDPPYEACVYYS